MKDLNPRWRITLGLGSCLASVLAAPVVMAQPKPPTGAFPVDDTSGAPQSSPATSSAPAAEPAAPAPAPAASGGPASPDVPPASTALIAPAGVPDGYGAPPPGAAIPPTGGAVPPTSEPPRSPGAADQRGLYFGGRLGVGGPFGADTTTSAGASYSEGLGVIAEAGYAFVPYFGVNLFLHWNHTSLAVEANRGLNLSDNSAHILLYGIEARGLLPAGPFVGWASVGVSLGTGSLSLATSDPAGGGTYGSRDTVNLKPTPVLGFGAEYEVMPGFFLGPELRWYLTNASRACEEPTYSGPPLPPGYVPPKQCTETFSGVTVPDVAFIGVGATYRVGLGK